MGFWRDLLGRPANEKAMLVMPVGYRLPTRAYPISHARHVEEISIWR
ncbi:MAG: hypothetical protein M3081_15370 [Gemmatimonadota bacterium]|nr:hypothetical protein [Gemmatimonadota bacterium]